MLPLPEGCIFEGAGDALACGETLFAGYHFRSHVSSHRELSRILGLFGRPVDARGHAGDTLTPPLLGLLVDLRARLRKEKNFALADEIRGRLAELGVTLEDRPDGTRWRIS